MLRKDAHNGYLDSIAHKAVKCRTDYQEMSPAIGDVNALFRTAFAVVCRGPKAMPAPATIETLKQRLPLLMEDLHSVQGLYGSLRTAELNGIVLSAAQRGMLDLLGAMSDEVVACLKEIGEHSRDRPVTETGSGS
jgi:hypothetical protein